MTEADLGSTGVDADDDRAERRRAAAAAFADEERPASLIWALRLLGVLVVFGGIVVLLMVLRNDDLIRAWAEGNPSAKRILDRYGLEVLKHPPAAWPGTDTDYTGARAPHFVAPALTLFAVLASLIGVLCVFLRNGFEWARICLTAIIFFAAVATVGGIRTGPPFLFEILPILAIALGIAVVVLMWLPPTTRYIHPRARVEPAGPDERAEERRDR